MKTKLQITLVLLFMTSLVFAQGKFADSNSHANDKQEFIPTIESVPEELSGEISTAVADTGYFSENNIADCEQMKIEPIISTQEKSTTAF